jgi:hypothetical protein
VTYEFDNDFIVGDTFYGVIGSGMVKNIHRHQNRTILDFLMTGELHLFDHSRKHVHRQQKYNFIVIKMNITPVLHVNLLCMVAILVTILI